MNEGHYMYNVMKIRTLYLKKKTEEKPLTALAYG